MDQVRAAEVIAALSLATDIATGLPLEHGLYSTLVATRLAERLDVDPEVASQAYYACLLFHIGCTADAHVAAELFPAETALAENVLPTIFGSRREKMTGMARALTVPTSAAPVRAAQVVRGLPKAVRSNKNHLTARCEVAQMLTERLGLPPSVQRLSGTSPSAGTAGASPARSGERRYRWPYASFMSPGTPRFTSRRAARSLPYGWCASGRAVRSTRP